MTHYEQRLEKDLERIKKQIAAVGERIEVALRNSVRSLLSLDRALAYDTILRDLEVNRAVYAIDRRCHAFVARHLPSAGHLRFVSAVLRLNVGMERVGDYAVSICREAAQLSEPVPQSVARDIELMADQTQEMLEQALASFLEGNAEAARATLAMGKQLSRTYENVVGDLLQVGEKGKRPLRDLFAVLIVFNRLGRVGDQAANTCEETIFAATGEIKAPKKYTLLFVDQRNDCQSQIAEAIARKAFPESGIYASAGWQPAAGFSDVFVSFMDEKGHSLRGAAPTKLDPTHHALSEYHVIVSLQGDLRDHVPEVPYDTVVLEWDVGRIPEPTDPDAEQRLHEIYRQVALQVEELMVMVRGDDAS